MSENQIVVYQPNETIRLEVRLENETVWLPQARIGDLFGVDRTVINKHIRNIYATGELDEQATCAKIAQVQVEGGRSVSRILPHYNLEIIIAVGYRVNSILATRFRQWATKILKDHLLRGYTVNSRLNQIEDKTDRRLMEHDKRLEKLESKVDFFVQTQTPPLKGVFYDGQIWDATILVENLITSAKKSILLIDNWATVQTLDMLAKKRTGVNAIVVTSEHRSLKTGTPNPKINSHDILNFNAQYPNLTVKFSERFHDRFLILDDKEIYLIGASLKDLGKKCFGFVRMDAEEIAEIKARI